ncbi:hypothetical protein LT493_00465 [Streptomyces tricolor]|nr:hypothetical protein [Streptomyces tricolor]
MEISPHPVLTVAMQQTAEAEGTELRVPQPLRRDRALTCRAFTTALAEVAAHGVPASPPAPARHGRRPSGRNLPTYALSSATATGSPRTAALAPYRRRPHSSAGHPLPPRRRGRTSRTEGGPPPHRPDRPGHPALADRAHRAVGGTAPPPGTAVLELVAHAGHRLGLPPGGGNSPWPRRSAYPPTG